MSQIKKVLVALDLSELDNLLVQFAGFLAKTTSAEKIYFVNVIRNFHIPDAVLKEFPHLIENAIEERKQQIKNRIEENLNCEAIIKQIIVKEGNPAKKILQMAKDWDIDLIVAGKKTSLEGGGVLVQRLARRAGCNLLIIPENCKPHIQKVLVPSDFSEHSKLALEAALLFAERNGPGVEVIIQNVFTVPAGYHYTGKSYEEFAEVMKKHAKRDYKKFIKDIDLRGQKLKDVYSLDQNENIVTDIYDKAREIKADVVIIGAKGRTAATALFLGSMAERAIQLNNQFPLLIVRPKGQNAGFMDFILDI